MKSVLLATPLLLTFSVFAYDTNPVKGSRLHPILTNLDTPRTLQATLRSIKTNDQQRSVASVNGVVNADDLLALLAVWGPCE